MNKKEQPPIFKHLYKYNETVLQKNTHSANTGISLKIMPEF